MIESDIHPAQGAASGLRDRKKARRRDEIMLAARDLFARQGIDATTMADIAAAAGISPPTVFNYFGSKDGILIAMIDEGARRARDDDSQSLPPQGADLPTLVLDLFARISARTLEIGSKRIWRYAEAAVIRQPQTDLAQGYRAVSGDLVGAITRFLEGYRLEQRAGGPCPAAYLAQVLYDLWMPCFLDLITDEAQDLAAHHAQVAAKITPLLTMVLTDDCLAAPQPNPHQNPQTLPEKGPNA